LPFAEPGGAAARFFLKVQARKGYINSDAAIMDLRRSTRFLSAKAAASGILEG